MARRNFEGTRAPLEARAGDFEIIADGALSFVKAPIIFWRSKLIFTSHGATSGQIDEDELFYLDTRGIPTKVAQRLLVTGFLDEVIQRLHHPTIAEHLPRLIEEKFAS